MNSVVLPQFWLPARAKTSGVSAARAVRFFSPWPGWGMGGMAVLGTAGASPASLASPMAMFCRIAIGTVPFYEIAIAVALLVLGVAAVGVFSAKVYRVGVLLYGNKPKIGSILKNMLKA